MVWWNGSLAGETVVRSRSRTKGPSQAVAGGKPCKPPAKGKSSQFLLPVSYARCPPYNETGSNDFAPDQKHYERLELRVACYDADIPGTENCLFETKLGERELIFPNWRSTESDLEVPAPYELDEFKKPGPAIRVNTPAPAAARARRAGQRPTQPLCGIIEVSHKLLASSALSASHTCHM